MTPLGARWAIFVEEAGRERAVDRLASEMPLLLSPNALEGTFLICKSDFEKMEEERSDRASAEMRER